MQIRSKSKVELKEVCKTCGKSRSEGKQDTFASWLFKIENCRCKRVDTADESTLDQAEEDYAERRKALKRMGEELTLGDNYRIIEKIGGGGMGTVYKVEDVKLHQTFAVKVLNPLFARDSSKKRRFIREVKALEQLDHPNIVTVYGYSEATNGLPFMVMEHIEGVTLSQMLREKTVLQDQDALPVFQSICEALEYAHGQGIVHRDLKPSNIMLAAVEDSQTVKVKVVDFGISKLRQEGLNRTTNLTQTGEIFGSPYYMSPEQCYGEEIDKRSDIYSLGCLMYETLTGKPPFHGGNPVGVIMSHIKDRPRPFKRANPDVETNTLIEAVIMQCLEKAPQDRFQTMSELASALKSAARFEKSEYLRRQRSFGKVNYAPIIAGLCLILFMEVAWAAGINRFVPMLSMVPKILGIQPRAILLNKDYLSQRYVSDRADTQEDALTEALGKKVPLNGCDFTELDLTGKVYDGAFLSESVFRDCNFTDAELSNINFMHADFINCKFVGASLTNCLMAGAHFEGCDFTHANFRGTPLKSTIIERCVFQGTISDVQEGE